MEFLEKRKVPYAVTALVGVNVLYFLYLLLTGSLSGMSLVQKGAIYIVNGHYRRGLFPLVASMFVHFDIRHIGGNMLMLLVVGELLEERLGSLRVLAAYLASGIAGNIVTIAWYCLRRETIVSAGASGAVFGLVGVLCFLVFRVRGAVPGFSRNRMLLMIFLMLYSGIANAGINTAAHVGGFLMGVVFGRLFLHAWVTRDQGCKG